MKVNLFITIFIFILSNVQSQVLFQDFEVTDDKNTAKGATAVFATDIDGDGDIDMISTSSSDDKIAWYENVDGQGNFGEQQIISIDADGASDVFAADIDNDGDIDVISASSFDDKIAWYENVDGQGNFGEQQIISIDADGASDVFAADIDNDGDIDVISASNFDDKIAWYENVDGQGNFGEQQIIVIDLNGASDVFAIDVDGDGDIDVLSSAEFDDSVSWYENMDGQGDFSDQQIIATEANGATAVFAADLDGDGDLDVLSALKADNKIVWYENLDGLGNFGNEQLVSDNVNSASSVYVADLDGDDDLDVLGTSSSSDEIRWYENVNGQGSFGTAQIVTTEVDGNLITIAEDLDGDGDMDVMSASWNDDKIAWYENLDGLGNFENQQIVTSLFTCSQARSTHTADLDGDGDLDVLSASRTDNKIAWYENLDNQGEFGVQQIISTVGGASSVYAADLDGDGDFDVLAQGLVDGSVWFENIDGLGSFSTPMLIAEDFTLSPRGIIAADFDGDDDLDVLVSTSTSLVWYENVNGQGDFIIPHSLSMDMSSGQSVQAVDIDDDGDLDVLSASSGDNKVAWFENLDGQGTFGAEIIITVDANNSYFASAGDIDGDGDLDVVAVSRFDSKVAWYENLNGQGDFGEQQIISTDGSVPRAIYPTDIDGDGDMDVIVAFDGDNKVAWYENIDGQGSFGVQQLISIVGKPWFVFPIDLDDDGDIDVLSPSFSKDKITFHKNLGIGSNEIEGFVNLTLSEGDCNDVDGQASNIMVITDDGTNTLATFSLNNGFYQIFPGVGNFLTSVIAPDYFSVDPISHDASFSGIGNTEVANFCLIPNQTTNDLNVSIYPTRVARPGFEVSYQLVYQNVGTSQLSGTVSLEYNDSKLSFLMSSQDLLIQNGNVLSLDYENLSPFETRVIDISFEVFELPITNIGDSLNFIASIDPIPGDQTEGDNSFDFKQEIVNSFDPNDISVLEGDKILLEDADKYLHYIIRFQNTGTASAVNINIKNEIDSDLDWNTLQLESASHANRVEIRNQSEINFIFDNINLADSTSSPSESQGFVAYKIKPKNDVSFGDVINSEADIFFDFNDPITTNMVNTEIVQTLRTDEKHAIKYRIFPNPTSQMLNIQTQNLIDRIEIYDQLGNLQLFNFNEMQINISALSPGIYICKFFDVNANLGMQKIIVL